ncbi:DNA-methyltransferase [Promicromonospora sp. NPDC057138]|uniref:DNA-methyltransferase n=1 Tax=Promicromonospora sp. NPDC057138 TaxID=3346031 RepID=UPI0036314B2C
MAEKIVDDGLAVVWHGDAAQVLTELPDSSVHAVITDPPYGLARERGQKFAKTVRHWAAGVLDYVPDGSGVDGHAWDAFVPPPSLWAEVLRVLKPGGYALIFAAPRTADITGLSLRLAGFEITDQILAWAYGGAMAKSRDVSRLIDDHLGETRPRGVVDRSRERRLGSQSGRYVSPAGWRSGSRAAMVTRPASAEAERWEGWSTALKPAQEPILVARRPIEGTVAENVLAHSAGALHTDAVKVRSDDGDRHPPNLVTAHHPLCLPARCHQNCVVADLAEQSRDRRGRGDATRFTPTLKYAAKPRGAEKLTVDGITHPTVKPMELVRWLVDLVAVPGMVVLDPFAGSGVVAAACTEAGIESVSVEIEEAYARLVAERLLRGGSSARDV